MLNASRKQSPKGGRDLSGSMTPSVCQWRDLLKPSDQHYQPAQYGETP